MRTKRKQANEANTKEADELIKDFLVRNYYHNQKTEDILIEYLKEKQKTDE